MTLDNLAVFAEVIGAIAVVVSLVYVGYQVKENTNAIRMQVHESVVGHVIELEGALLNNADLARIIVKADSTTEKLTPDEQLRAGVYYTNDFVIWESAYLHYKQGFIKEEVWIRWDISHKPDEESRGQFHYWTRHRHWFEDTFALHVDKSFEEVGFPRTDGDG